MKKINDGGKAFPVAIPEDCNDYELGMSLRDYFAAKAMPYLQDKVKKEYESGKDLYAEKVAQLSYEIADAMLKAREAK